MRAKTHQLERLIILDTSLTAAVPSNVKHFFCAFRPFAHLTEPGENLKKLKSM